MPRIWSAGCSIGAEIYSIAMLLIKQGARARELLGTDIDEVILAKREGTYLDSEVGGVPPDLLKAHFVKSRNLYQISIHCGAWPNSPATTFCKTLTPNLSI